MSRTCSTATAVIVNLRGQAEAQAANATANQAAALAEADLGTSLDTAQLLAVGAYQLHDDPLTEAALFQAAAAAPHLVRYYQAGGQVTSLGTAADGRALVTGTATGQLDWFSPASGARHAIQTSLGAISQVAVDAAGDVVMAADKKQAIIWHPGSGRTATVLSGGDGLSIALSPSGQYAAIAQQGPSQVVNGQMANSGKIFVRDDRTGQLRESDYTGYYDHLAFTSARVVTASSCGFWQSFAVPAVARAGRGDQGVCPATAALAGSSSSGQFSAFASNGSSVAWPTTDPSHILSANNMAPGAASYVTVSDDGKRAAIVEGGTIYVAALGPYSMEPGAGTGTTRLTANGDTTTSSDAWSSHQAGHLDPRMAESVWNRCSQF